MKEECVHFVCIFLFFGLSSVTRGLHAFLRNGVVENEVKHNHCTNNSTTTPRTKRTQRNIIAADSIPFWTTMLHIGGSVNFFATARIASSHIKMVAAGKDGTTNTPPSFLFQPSNAATIHLDLIQYFETVISRSSGAE